MQTAEIAQHAGRDADAGRCQRRADEEMGGGRRIGHEQSADAVAQSHGQDDAHDGDRKRAAADMAHLAHARFQPDLEQEQDDADIREQPECQTHQQPGIVVAGRRLDKVRHSGPGLGRRGPEQPCRRLGDGGPGRPDLVKERAGLMQVHDDGEYRQAHLVADIADDDADQQLAQNIRLIAPAGRAPADHGQHDDERGGEEDDRHRVAMPGRLAASVLGPACETLSECQDQQRRHRDGANTAEAGNYMRHAASRDDIAEWPSLTRCAARTGPFHPLLVCAVGSSVRGVHGTRSAP